MTSAISRRKALTPLETIIRREKTRMSLTGLTFIEIFIVIIIIGILTGISFPKVKKTFNNLQLDNFSRELQSLMNYLHERSIIEGEPINLNIDNKKKEIWSSIQSKDEQIKLKSYPIPDGIRIEIETEPLEAGKNQIYFTPDGQINKVTIRVINTDNQEITLTTKGVFGGVKILLPE